MKVTRIFAVIDNNPSADHPVRGLFSTLKKAKTYCKGEDGPTGNLQIDTFEVDCQEESLDDLIGGT